jgi:hypothetical protein
VKAPSTDDDDAVLGKNPQSTPMKQFVHTQLVEILATQLTVGLQISMSGIGQAI